MFNSTYATVIEMVADIQNNQENNIKLDTSITNIEVGNYIKALGLNGNIIYENNNKVFMQNVMINKVELNIRVGSIIIFALYIYVAKKEILWNKSMKNYALGLGGIIGIYFAVIVYYLWQLKHWMEKFSGLDAVKEIGKEQGILNLSTKYARESTMMGMVVYVAFFIVLWIALKKNTENKEA